mmetsp:Transcript_53814/g.151610  ORF Transcript_53814/g.151610 Transcript_53814/m.151610 type:complete len:212 (+) Transcript_53814:652-1287(+)
MRVQKMAQTYMKMNVIRQIHTNVFNAWIMPLATSHSSLKIRKSLKRRTSRNNRTKRSIAAYLKLPPISTGIKMKVSMSDDQTMMKSKLFKIRSEIGKKYESLFGRCRLMRRICSARKNRQKSISSPYHTTETGSSPWDRAFVSKPMTRALRAMTKPTPILKTWPSTRGVSCSGESSSSESDSVVLELRLNSSTSLSMLSRPCGVSGPTPGV